MVFQYHRTARSFVAFVFGLLILSAFWPFGSALADEVVRREIFRDVSGQLDIDTVQSQSFSPQEGIFVGGYTQDVIWLRLVVRASNEPLVIKILPAYLNELTLYSPESQVPGNWLVQKSGNSVPWKERPFAAVALGFPLQQSHQAETVHYLRLKTITNSLLDVRVIKAQNASQENSLDFLWQGLYFAIILWVVLWAMQDYWLSKDKVLLSFATSYLINLAYALGILGYLSLLLPNSLEIPKITFYLVFLAILSSINFHRNFLYLFDISTFGRWALNILLLSCFGIFVMHILEKHSLALMFSSFIALLSSPLLLLAAFTTKKESIPDRLHIRIYYGLITISLAFYILPILGLSKASVWTHYGALIQSMISALLFAHLLHARSRQLKAMKINAELQLSLAKQKLAHQKSQLAEQSQFTAMLTHELKNPLATIRLNIDSLKTCYDNASLPVYTLKSHRIERAIDEINRLIDQCVLADNLEQDNEISAGAFELTDFYQLLDECLEGRSGRSRVKVHCSDEKLPPLMSHPRLLAIVVNNLIDNAFKYAPPEATIEAKLEVHSAPGNIPAILFSISNPPGRSGFPDPAHVFKKYYRSQQSSWQSGYGLGLYLVKSVTQKLGGSALYAPTENRITFQVWIPLSLH